MREIDKSTTEQPTNTKHNSKTFQNRVLQAISQKDNVPEKRNFSGYADKKAKEALAKLYSGGNVIEHNGEKIYNPKCAYCESTSAVVASLEVEHYRPKKAVTEEPSHKGYYWLAYEWTNLIYACSKCNEQGAKGNQFPVLGTRQFSEPMLNGTIEYDAFRANHDDLLVEQPLLLHPEIDRNFEQHFRFRYDGTIEGLSSRGEATIRICKLDRILLVKERRDVLKKLTSSLQATILAFDTRSESTEEEVRGLLRNLYQEIIDYQTDTSLPYTLFGKHINYYFDEFVLSGIKSHFHESIKNTFQMFLDGKL
jgi:uncharacterized protein (TIGR02646 family)